MRDKLEVGAPGSFDACETTEQVVAALLSDQTPAEVLESLATLSAEVEAYAASHATLVPAAEPARPRPDEVGLALGYLRRRR
jgi:hypothetical protein